MEIGFRSEIYLLFLGGAKGVMMSQKKKTKLIACGRPVYVASSVSSPSQPVWTVSPEAHPLCTGIP
jgi:hypothetical protein